MISEHLKAAIEDEIAALERSIKAWRAAWDNVMAQLTRERTFMPSPVVSPETALALLDKELAARKRITELTLMLEAA